MTAPLRLHDVACPRCGALSRVNIPAGRQLLMVMWLDPKTPSKEAQEEIGRQLARFGIEPSPRASYLRVPCQRCFEHLDGADPDTAKFVAVLDVQ